VPGSSEYTLLSSLISNYNLDAAVSIFFPTGMKVYFPGDIFNICAKFVTLPHQKILFHTTIHQTSVVCPSVLFLGIC